MNPTIEEIYKTRTAQTSDGINVPLSSEISRDEGKMIYSLVHENPAIVKTLEVGCAQGLSTLHICEALKGRANARHFIIDPFQTKEWRGIGMQGLKRAGLTDMAVLIEKLSEVALPELLAEHENTFDFVFIDGWHTFDHTLVDAFFGLRLLKTGGILVIDDCDIASVGKVAEYLKNYPCLEIYRYAMDYPSTPWIRLACKILQHLPLTVDQRHRLPKKLRKAIRRPNMIAFKKVSEDKRPWNWYAPF